MDIKQNENKPMETTTRASTPLLQFSMYNTILSTLRLERNAFYNKSCYLVKRAQLNLFEWGRFSLFNKTFPSKRVW